MAEYIIYKKAEGVFEIVKDNLIFISDSKWSGTQIDGLFTFKSENGARLFANVPFSEVSYVDETGGGSVASFASAISLHNKLKEVGFFDASTTPGSGGADTFKQLADAFSSFTGRDGQVVYINGNVLDSKTIANNEFLSDLGDTNLQTVQNIPSGHILRVVTITEGDQTIQRWSAVPFPTENNIPANGYLELGTVTKIGNEINVSTGFLWIIDGIQLGNTIAYDFTIEDADSGDSRVDIIVAESDGTFSLIQGEPSAGSGNAIAPIPNSDQLLLTTVYIYEDAISEPTIPISDGQYVNKVEYQYQGVNATGDGILTDYPLNGINSALDLVSGVTRLNSVLITAAYSLYKGKELAIRNSQLTNVIITDGSGFNFHNGEDFILLPGQVIKLKEYGLEFDFLGTFGGTGSSGVQTVTAGNPLAVNNSDPSNPVLNVATPAVAQSYATTAENNAKSYADGLVVGLLDDRGNYDASTNLFPATGGSGASGSVLKGDLWTISVAGTLGGVSVGIGDVVRALSNTPGQTSSNWVVTEHNFGYVAENSANKKNTVAASATDYPNMDAVIAYVNSVAGDQYKKKQMWLSYGETTLTKIGVRLGTPEIYVGTKITPDSSSYVARIRNVRQSTTTAGSSAEIYTGSDGILFASYTYGFKWIFDFNFTGASGCAVSAGIKAAGGAKGNIEPSTSLNVVQLAADSGDTQMQIMHNDGTGTCTKIALGSDWPAVFTDDISYRLILTTLSNSRQVSYTAIRMISKTINGQVVLDQFDRQVSGLITTNISTATGATDSVSWSIYAGNRLNTTATTVSVSKVELETTW